MADDTIYRQAAIDAVGINTWAGQRLLKVPAVQPEIEITVDQVIEFCEKNGLVVHSLSYFQWLQSRYEQGQKDGYTQGFRESAYIYHDKEVTDGI